MTNYQRERSSRFAEVAFHLAERNTGIRAGTTFEGPDSPAHSMEKPDEIEETLRFLEISLPSASMARVSEIAKMLIEEQMGVSVLKACVRHGDDLTDKLGAFAPLTKLKAGEKLAIASAL